MPLNKRINDLIKNMINASEPGADYVEPAKENSMLPSSLLQSALDNYLQNIIPAYQHQYTTSDQVLEGLVSYIIDQIDLLRTKTLMEIDGQIKSLGDLTTNNQEQFKSLVERRSKVEAWNKSVTNKDVRSEFNGNTEIGRYHTALRVLLDQETISWPSLLHKGSKEYVWTPNQKSQIYYRDLLAYFWLAACASGDQENFISNLHEIGRAHNEGIYTYSPMNNPSCSPGTIGRLLAHSCISNEITEAPFINKNKIPSYENVPNRIEKFIVNLLKKQSPEIQRSVFLYINDKLLCLDSVSEEDKENFYKFVQTLESQKLSLVNFVEGSIEHLPETLIRLNSKQAEVIVKSITDTYDILIKDFIDIESDSSISANFLAEVREFTVAAYQETLEKKLIFLNIDSYFLELRKVYLQVNAINYLIDNEVIRGLLDPDYASSEKATAKKTFFSNVFIQELHSKLDELEYIIFSTISQKVEEALAEQGIRIHNQSTFFQVLEKCLSKEEYYKLQVRITDLKKNITGLEKKLTQSPNDSQDILPLAPGETQNHYNPSPEQWALNFIRVLSFSQVPTALDEEELNRLLNQMISRSERESTFNNQMIACIHKYINQPHIVPKNKTIKINEYIYGILASKDGCLGNYWQELNSKAEEDKDIILPSVYINKLDEDSNKLAKLPIHKFDNQSNEHLNAWLAQASELYKSDQSGSQLIDFVILSIVHNLCIPGLNKNEVDVITWLCKLYLFSGSSNAQPLPFLVTTGTDIAKRIEYLGQHFVILLTTLKTYSSLYGANWLTLMSRSNVDSQLKQSDKLNPFILRVSNSEPNTVLISYVNSYELLCKLLYELSKKGPDACRQMATKFNISSNSIDLLVSIEKEILNKICQPLSPPGPNSVQVLLADEKYRSLIQELNNAKASEHLSAHAGMSKILEHKFMIDSKQYSFKRPSDKSLIDTFAANSKYASSLLSGHALSTILTPEFELQQKEAYAKSTQSQITTFQTNFYTKNSPLVLFQGAPSKGGNNPKKPEHSEAPPI